MTEPEDQDMVFWPTVRLSQANELISDSFFCGGGVPVGAED